MKQQLDSAALEAHQTEVKNQILDAGRRVLERDALASLAEIGKTAGFRKSIIHYYFANKGEFVRAVYQRAVDTGTVSDGLNVCMLVTAQRSAELAEHVLRLAPGVVEVNVGRVLARGVALATAAE